MATGQPFSLFPRSVPKIATPNPHKRQPSLHTATTLRAVDEEQPVPDLNGIPLEVRAQSQATSRSRTPSPETIGMAVTTASPLDGNSLSPLASHPPPPAVRRNPPPPPLPLVSLSPDPSRRSGSATLVQEGFEAKSPVVPIRSMFPQFNPSLSLAQQNYCPQRPYPVHGYSNVSRGDYRNTLTTPIDRQIGPRSAPPSVLNFADTMSVMDEPQFSSHRELEKLWEATHGSEPSSLIKAFDLEMSRTSEACFTFGADPQYPFYTLQTYDTSEIMISKTNPVKRSETREVVLSAIEPRARHLPPNDGLVSFIFPKMAAMLALNQSAALAKAHDLAITDKDDVEAAAIKRAASQEACHLRWNASKRIYQLEHPAVARRYREPNFVKSPASPNGSMIMPIEPHLHLTVSSNSSSAPSIIVTNPNATSPTPGNSANAGIRLSTIPQSDTTRPLASLDLASKSLHIDADQILSIMPSLFAIDAIVCAMFAVAIADEAVNPVLGEMPLWMPRPKAPMSQYGGSMKSYAGSTFYATLAEREEAEGEAKRMEKEHKQDMRDHKKSDTEASSRTWYGKRKEKVDKKKKQIVIGEFDLEKLGHYQGGDRKGEELPVVVRSIMSVLVGLLKFITWLLSSIVRFICWILVGMTRCVTSEKF